MVKQVKVSNFTEVKGIVSAAAKCYNDVGVHDMKGSIADAKSILGMMSLEDLKPGMELTGTVRNVIDFGAFVDLGVHQDGLVHVSQISDKFIKHPSEVLKVGDIVRVKVLNVDTAKKRIALTMKGLH